jgi:thermitase
MTNSTRSLRTSIALILGAAVVPLTLNAEPSAGFREGVLLVKPNPGLPIGKLEKELETVNGKVRRKLNGLEVQVVEVPPGQEAHLANQLNKNKHFAFAEPDMLVEPSAVVDDPYFGSQWHLPVMGAPSAWTYANGKGVTVAVCDSGVFAEHPDLLGQVSNGINTVDNTTNTTDINGHGTKVAGVIAALANNTVGVASVAPAAKILAMRISNTSDGSAYYSDMAECVTYAADRGARVANISYSGAAGSMTVSSAASYMMNKVSGVVVVAAANNGIELTYANDPYLFVAAATDSSDNRASYSNYGNFIDVAAPGTGIYTTTSTGGYASVSGTSFAAPNTAATVALVMSANLGLTGSDATAIVTNTAKDLGTAGWDKYFGFGRVDAAAAGAMAASVTTSDRTAPAVAVASPGTGATVSDLVTVDVQAQDDFGVASVDFLVDGNLVATDTQEDPANPYHYRFSWDSSQVPDGSHKLIAKAKDAAGNVGSAKEVAVTVANTEDTTPPVITSLSPASDATASGSASLSATASDNVAVTSLTISTSNGFQCTSAASSASCTWNLSNVSEGYYTVTATARDAAGYQAAESHTVFVKATTTTTTPTSPTKKPPPGLEKKK